MASRKAEKDAARAQREALEREHQAAAQRRQRLYILGGALAVVVVVVAVVIVASSGGGTKKVATGAGATKVTSQVNTLLADIPQSGNRLGKPSAPVTMQYFGDLECPICQAFTLGSLPQIIDTYVRPGKLKVNYRSLETASRDPSTFEKQQVAALAAGKQNRMWEYLELFYRQQGQEDTPYVTEAFLDGLAKQVPGLDIAKWKTDRADPALAQQVTTDAAAAHTDEADGTPTLVISGPNGKRTLTGDVPFADASQAIQAVS